MPFPVVGKYRCSHVFLLVTGMPEVLACPVLQRTAACIVPPQKKVPQSISGCGTFRSVVMG